MVLPPKPIHPTGELPEVLNKPNLLAANVSLAVETFGGRVHVEWDPQAAVTPLGQLPFFIEFLKMGNLLTHGLMNVLCILQATTRHLIVIFWEHYYYLF